MEDIVHRVALADLQDDAPGLLSAHYPVAIWPEHKADILKHGVERIQSEQKDPSLYWMKIEAPGTGRIAAAIQWKFFETDPYVGAASSPPLVPFWLPDTPMTPRVRELASAALDIYVAPRAPMRRRPHAWINSAFTHLDDQGKGMAGALIEWGVRKADEMGLEAHVEASPLWRPVYARYGFIQVATNHVYPKKEDDEDWNGLLKAFNFPQLVYLMWRPPGGQFDSEKTSIPWKGGLKPNEDWQKLFE